MSSFNHKGSSSKIINIFEAFGRVHPVGRNPLRRIANCTALKDVDP